MIRDTIEKYLWVATLLFISFLLIGSFIISRNFFELLYVAILYLTIVICKSGK